jgi:hypothetical protein
MELTIESFRALERELAARTAELEARTAELDEERNSKTAISAALFSAALKSSPAAYLWSASKMYELDKDDAMSARNAIRFYLAWATNSRLF